jgi:hypothetical protein
MLTVAVANFAVLALQDEEEQDEAAPAAAAAADKPATGGSSGDGEGPSTSGAGEGPAAKRPKFSKLGKDPGVATSFLPDKDREVQEEDLRQQLKRVSREGHSSRGATAAGRRSSVRWTCHASSSAADLEQQIGPQH